MNLLRIENKSVTSQIKMTREKERQFLKNARSLRGKYPHRHGKEENPPSMPKDVEKAFKWATANPEKAVTEAQHAYEVYWGLTHFRKNRLRRHARCVHLALTFLRGQPLEVAENVNHTDPDFLEIERMVFMHGIEDSGIDPREVKQNFERWVQEGTRHHDIAL